MDLFVVSALTVAGNTPHLAASLQAASQSLQQQQQQQQQQGQQSRGPIMASTANEVIKGTRSFIMPHSSNQSM